MDFVWIALGIILLLGGLAGCIIPALPGPPLAYVSLLLIQLTEKDHFSVKFLLIWAVIVIVVTILDYLIPPYATKRFGGTRKGVIGSSVGVIAGLFLFPPWGIIILPFFGALIGEMIAGKEQRSALRAAVGSFLGFLGGVMLKLAVTIVIGYHFFRMVFG